jgi:hypothetical protein
MQSVHSFDLVASAPGVIACNMSDVPLPDEAVDAAVFSLALMGTDYGSFLQVSARGSRFSRQNSNPDGTVYGIRTPR